MLVLAAIVSSLHVLALALGLPAVTLRGRALRGALDDAGLRRLFVADTIWGVAAALWLTTGLLRAFAGLEKGSAFYVGSALFWAKMALFVMVTRQARAVRRATTLGGRVKPPSETTEARARSAGSPSTSAPTPCRGTAPA